MVLWYRERQGCQAELDQRPLTRFALSMLNPPEVGWRDARMTGRLPQAHLLVLTDPPECASFLALLEALQKAAKDLIG